MAGVSEEQVRLALNLDRRFVDKPALREALVSGAVSINKLTKIASIATVENAAELALLKKKLTQKALEVFVRDEKMAISAEKDVSSNGLQMMFGEDESMRAQTLKAEIPRVILSTEVNEKLAELRQKGFDVNELLLELLNKREVEIEQRKEEISRKMEGAFSCTGANAGSESDTGSGASVSAGETKKSTPVLVGSSRHIPIVVKKVLNEEFGSKCAISGCKKPHEFIHHTARFAIARKHDPRFMAPLCREHHLIAHVVDERFVDKYYGLR